MAKRGRAGGTGVLSGGAQSRSSIWVDIVGMHDREYTLKASLDDAPSRRPADDGWAPSWNGWSRARRTWATKRVSSTPSAAS